MKHNQITIDFIHRFAESKGIDFNRMISIEIGVNSLIYKFIDLHNKTINTVEEMRSNNV